MNHHPTYYYGDDLQDLWDETRQPDTGQDTTPPPGHDTH